jgi:AraC-like DNA-binding protein
MSLKDNFLTDKNEASLLKPLFYKIIENKDDLYIASGYCTVLLASLAKKLGLTESKKNDTLFLTKEILIYLEENYMNDPTLKDLADHFGFSRNYMSRIFNSKIKMNYSEYLNYLKLKHAASDIAMGKESITDISFKHGFGSLASFYRCFKECYGTSPKAMQRAQKAMKS